LFCHGRLDRSGQTLYASHRFLWLSALVGGLMFGFGMARAVLSRWLPSWWAAWPA
jgi:uncharacterized membrane protein YedE/YeeE